MDAPLVAHLLVGVCVAASLAYVGTPVAIAAARRFGFYDSPTGYKGHTRPTPYLGGAAVMLAFAVATALAAGDWARTLPLLAGIALLLGVGTIDDRRTVRPWIRVAVELALGVLLSVAGLGWELGAGAGVDAAVTAVWVVAVVNSFNLFDNMDGAASSMAAIVCAGTCALAVSTGADWAAVASAALCGACLGFLPYNLCRPAKIFLGDGGSMPLGFAIAALVAVAARAAEPAALSLLVGFLLVGIPAVDTALVVVSRRRRGVSILSGGQDHLTHRARPHVRTAISVVFVLGAAQAILSAMVIVAIHGTATGLVYVLLGFVACAAMTIVALEGGLTRTDESRSDAPTGEASTGEREQSSHTWADRLRERAVASDGASIVILCAVGLAAGLSPMFDAYYNVGVWTPVGLLIVVAAAVGTVARRPRLSRTAVAAVCALAGLGVWSLVSTSWSPTVEQATVDGNRWLVYAALLLLSLVLMRTRRHAAALMLGVGTGIGVVAAIVTVRLLGADGATMFIGGRLNLPLGYVNGEGCVFAMGCWLSIALAERRRALVAGLGAAWTVVFASLALLSQSRGIALAMIVSVLVTLVALPGRRRRVLLLVVVALALAPAAHTLLDVYSSAGSSGQPSSSVLHSAVRSMLLAALGAGVAWGALVAALTVATARGGRAATQLRRVGSAVAVIAVLAPVVVGIARFGSVQHTATSQWHAFVHLSAAGSVDQADQTRLLSGGGNRYDYWRIAWDAFTSQPLRGVGAGGYTVSYYKQRRTFEAIQNPHSVELELLAELGIVGLALFALYFASAALATHRWLIAARESASARTLAVGAMGISITWLVETSGDWMHLLPGVTAISVLAVAVLCMRDPAPALQPVPAAAEVASERWVGRPLVRVGLAAAAAFVLAVSGASLMRSSLSQFYLDAAEAQLASNPVAALQNATRALRLDGANLDSYYVKAAAIARSDNAPGARAVLLQAAAEQPSSFVTWTLLGDLEVRAGNIGLARGYYQAAQSLDPHDPTLTALVANPRRALQRTAGS